MYTAYGMSLLVTGGRVVNGMVWEDFNIVISNQIFAFVFVFFFFFFRRVCGKQHFLWERRYIVLRNLDSILELLSKLIFFCLWLLICGGSGTSWMHFMNIIGISSILK